MASVWTERVRSVPWQRAAFTVAARTETGARTGYREASGGSGHRPSPRRRRRV